MAASAKTLAKKILSYKKDVAFPFGEYITVVLHNLEQASHQASDMADFDAIEVAAKALHDAVHERSGWPAAPSNLEALTDELYSLYRSSGDLGAPFAGHLKKAAALVHRHLAKYNDTEIAFDLIEVYRRGGAPKPIIRGTFHRGSRKYPFSTL